MPATTPARIPIPEKFTVAQEESISITIVGEVVEGGKFHVPKGITLQGVVSARDTEQSPLRPDRMGGNVALVRGG